MIPYHFPTAEELNVHDCRTSVGFGWLDLFRGLRKGSPAAARSTATAYRVCPAHCLALCSTCSAPKAAGESGSSYVHSPEMLTGRGGARAVQKARRLARRAQAATEKAAAEKAKVAKFRRKA